MMVSARGGTFCAKMSVVGENVLYQVSDGAEVVRSVVSPAGKLVNCSITATHVQVKSFVQECRMLGMRARPDAPFTRMEEVRSMCREMTQRAGRAKADTSEDFEEPDKTLRRSKRGFTYPGTLWCGAGNMADSYEQLGHFSETDSCCRIHDHCPHVIHAFSSKYGHTNFKWHSICHCDCDNALKACLRRVNDTSSRVVGQAFFNVIGVPCFDLVYEEQCAERHWYGMCSRYEQLPVAVLRDAVPYDFGGIDVIDELTMTPPHARESTSSSGEEKAGSPTPSAAPGPDEPSLRNVVTAAEDFIKVLATVSTSQSSNAESDKGEAQRSEKKKKKKKKKKKRKNSGKNQKTDKKPKSKAEGRKRKQQAGVRLEEGAAVSPSGGKTDHMKTLSNFISESHRRDQSSTNSNRVGDGEFELEGRDEPSNQVMKDEPAADEQEAPARLEPGVAAEGRSLSGASRTVTPQKTQKDRRQRTEKGRETRPPGWGQLAVTPSEKVTAAPVRTNIGSATTARQSLTDTRPAVGAAGPPTLQPSRSKGGEDRRTGSSASPLVLPAAQGSSAVDLEVALSTVPPVTHRQLHTGKAWLNSSLSSVQRLQSREKTLRKRRRKTLPPPPPGEILSFPLSPFPEFPESTTAAQRRATQHEPGLLPTAASTEATKRRRQGVGKQTSRRRKASVGAGQTRPETLTAAAEPTLSPVGWTIQRARAQFARKKRRKAALLKRRMA
ncbi:uncharacterized protein LOC115399948 isoform X2 [Salarias fasciatus]|nr:uncharacterized protein LOC115399948 isoform X2 [Salarias fasciatus]